MELGQMGKGPKKRTKDGQQKMEEVLVRVAEVEAAVWAKVTTSGIPPAEEREGEEIDNE
jgi:hypothetical protein